MCLVTEPDLLSCEEYADFMLASAVAKATVVGLCLFSLVARLARLAVHLRQSGQLKIRSKNVVTRRRTQSLIAIAASLVGNGLGQAYDIVVHRLGEYDATARGECDRNRTATIARSSETVRLASIAVIVPMNTTTCIVLLFMFLLWLDLVEKAAMVTFWRKRLVLVVVGVVCVALTVVSIYIALGPRVTGLAIGVGAGATYLVHGTLLYGPMFAEMLLRAGKRSIASESGSQKIGRLIRVNARFILVSFILTMSTGLNSLANEGIGLCTLRIVTPALIFLAWVWLIHASIAYFETAESKSWVTSPRLYRTRTDTQGIATSTSPRLNRTRTDAQGMATSNSMVQVQPICAVQGEESA